MTRVESKFFDRRVFLAFAKKSISNFLNYKYESPGKKPPKIATQETQLNHKLMGTYCRGTIFIRIRSTAKPRRPGCELSLLDLFNLRRAPCTGGSFSGRLYYGIFFWSIGDYLWSLEYFKNYSLWLIISFISIAALLVNDKYVPGVLRDFLLENTSIFYGPFFGRPPYRFLIPVVSFTSTLEMRLSSSGSWTRVCAKRPASPRDERLAAAW